MKKWIYLLLTFGLVLLITTPASALSTYTSSYSNMDTTRNTWLSDLGITAPNTTIDFESGFSQDQDLLDVPLSGGLTITSTAGYAYVTDDSSDLGGSTPLDIYALAIDEGDDYTFTFNESISYFGFYMMDNNSTSLTINYTDGTTESTSINTSGASGLNGTFLALIFDKQVSSLYIPTVNGGDGEVGIDNVEFGNTVPIPGALWLLGSGLLGLIAIQRRKKI